MAKLSRRDLFRGAGALGLTATTVRAQPAAQTPAREPYRFFNAQEAAFVEAAVDRLIPPDSQWPGAKDAGVPIYIDRQLDGPFGRGNRMYMAGPWKQGLPGQGYQLPMTPAQLYRTSLTAIAKNMEGNGGPLAGRSPDNQDAYLKSLEAGEVDLGGFSSAIFFETLLANTIEGFFADPAYGGNRDMAGWRMIGFPGAHAGFLGLYTHHGMKFDGEPIGMDHLHHRHG
jgi:gluconate 2-dehydrogenase gamma chain